MKCSKCSKEFSTHIKIAGKKRNLQRRKFCFDCSPFGKHNTKDISNRPDEAKCKVCNASLRFNQLKFCCGGCKTKYYKLNKHSYAYQQGRALERKLKFITALGGKCEMCGYSKNIGALQFHHTDPKNKQFNLDARKLSNTNLAVLEEELAKCKLLCANCHTESHYPYLNLDSVRQAGCSNH